MHYTAMMTIISCCSDHYAI